MIVQPLITVPQPTDVDGTDMPLWEGDDLTRAATALTVGVYLATREQYDEDGDPMLPEDGTLTVCVNGFASFRPFARTIGTAFGVTGGGDLLCGYSCPDLTDEDTDPMRPATLATLGEWFDLTDQHCHACGTKVLGYDHEGGTTDVMLALAAAVNGHTLTELEVERTGGNCSRVVAVLADGRRVWATDGDAFRPDGIGLWAALAADDEDDNPATLYEGAHDPVALYRKVRAALAPVAA